MTPSPGYQRTIDALVQCEDERREAEAERDRLRAALETILYERYEGTRLTQDEMQFVAAEALGGPHHDP